MVVVRIDTDCPQGWAEVAAYHVDRVIGLNRKPPTTVRVLSNIERYEPSTPTHESEASWIDRMQDQR